MHRRSFLGALGAGASVSAFAQPADETKRTQYYSVDNYLLKAGSQATRIHDFFKAAIPSIRKVHHGPMLVMDAVIAPHVPQVAVITGFSSLDEMAQTRARVSADPDYMKALSGWEDAPEQPFETQNSTLLQAAPYSPEMTPDREPRKKTRVFELRTYHSPTTKQLRALHERFAGPEIQIFHRSGIFPLLYSSTFVGANMPNLTYLIPFDSLDAREKAWNIFGADPEWVKVRNESIEKHGQISSVIQISLYKATAYSPVG